MRMRSTISSLLLSVLRPVMCEAFPVRPDGVVEEHEWHRTPTNEQKVDFCVALHHEFPGACSGTHAGRRLAISGSSEFRIIGVLPSEIGQNSRLDELNVLDTGISGTLPTTLGTLSTMSRQLVISHNMELSGTMPTERGRLAELSGRLELYNNRLSGTLPSELGRLTRLQTLFVAKAHTFHDTVTFPCSFQCQHSPLAAPVHHYHCGVLTLWAFRTGL